MHRFASILTVMIALASCVAGTRSDRPRLTESEVLSLADSAAGRSGEDLTRFEPGEAHFEFVDHDHTWSVFYLGIVQQPGKHFLVIVNDRTKSTKVFGGE